MGKMRLRLNPFPSALESRAAKSAKARHTGTMHKARVSLTIVA